MAKYDYLIVGAGLFGAVFAYEAGKRGKSCLEHIFKWYLLVQKQLVCYGSIYLLTLWAVD